MAKLIVNNPDELITEVIQVQTSFSGPLPSPDDFKQYEDALPGAAERILAMAEKEQQMRANSNAKQLSNDSKRINIASLHGI